MSKENLNENNNNNSDSRAEKLKMFSIASVLILAAIIILGNFLLDKVLGKALTYDFSYSSQNSVSNVTADYLKSLPEGTHVRIVGLFDKPDNVESTPYQYIIPLLDDYVRKSDGKVTVEYINPSSHPSIINELDPNNVYDLASNYESFVIEYNGRIKIIAPIDCYYYDSFYYQTNGNYLITGNNTEFTFTNSMYMLTQGITRKAYIITGLKESGNTSITKILESLSMEVEELPVSDSFVVPEDCNLLVLNGPNTDISEKVYLAVSEYLNHGGDMFIAVNYNVGNVTEKFDRLNLLLNQMNINVDPLLVYENDTGYQFNGSSVNSIVRPCEGYSDYASITYFSNSYARSVRQSDNTADGVTASPVLATSDNASILQLDSEGRIVEGGVENVGKHYVAMYSVKDNVDPSKVFVFGTMDFSSDEYINQHSLNDGNVDFLKSCLRELTDTNVSAQLVIPAKNIVDYSIDPSKATTSNSTLMLVMFMVVIPVVLISMAIIVYAKRKNL